jgi:hypothetical protein
VNTLERLLELAIITEMLQDVRGIDLRTAFVRKKRQVIAVADAIDDRSRQSV